MSESAVLSNRSTSLQPPIARRDPVVTHLHEQTLVDDYAWLRNKGDEEVMEYLSAENEFTDADMLGTEDFQASLYKMLSHIQETDETVPYRIDSFLYFSRTVEGLQYPIHCRRPVGEDAAEECVLNVNLLAKGEPYMAVGEMAVSPNGKLLAYSTDNTGFRQYTLHIRDLTTGQDLPDTAVRVGSFAWAADSKTLLFTTEDEQTKRHSKLFRHTLNDGVTLTSDNAELVLEETDERFNLGVGRTRDRKYFLVESGSHTTNEYQYLSTDQPFGSLTLIAPRLEEQEYYPDHRDGYFYLRTNDTTKNFRLVAAPETSCGREHWKEFYAGQENTPLEDFDLFQSFLVLTERKAGLPGLTVHSLDERGSLGVGHPILFPEPAYTVHSGSNFEFASTIFRYQYTSLVSPPSVYEYDTLTGSAVLLKQQAVPGGFSSGNYASERLWIEAPDGVKVPVSLVYRRDCFATDGSSPLYVYGYGSYGYALPVGFSPVRLAMLDRGVVMAYAHIRGGGELGDAWHDAGKMRTKRNTFTDFIAVIEALVAGGYGAADRVAVEGGSAGGLLLGALVNMRPDLVRTVLSHVPFVDVMNTMLDASLPLTVAEYEEWGNPNEAGDFAYMLSYSPYENLKEGAYPAMLMKTSLNDSQVMYWEPAKYIAKLRTLKRNETPLLLKINMDAGHGGASGRYDYLKEIAFDYTFLLRELNVPLDPARSS